MEEIYPLKIIWRYWQMYKGGNEAKRFLSCCISISISLNETERFSFYFREDMPRECNGRREITLRSISLLRRKNKLKYMRRETNERVQKEQNREEMKWINEKRLNYELWFRKKSNMEKKCHFRTKATQRL